MERLGKALGTTYEVMEWATKGKRLKPWIDVLSANPKHATLIVKLSLKVRAPSPAEIAELYQALALEVPGADITLTVHHHGQIQGGVLVDAPPTNGEQKK